MRSAVAEDVAQRTRAEVRSLSPADRIRLSFSLGDRDIQIYCAVHEVDRDDAIRVFGRNRRHGRRHSGVIDDLDS